MITPGGTFEPKAPSYPPAMWDEDERIQEPEQERLPDEAPNPNADENDKETLYFRLQ